MADTPNWDEVRKIVEEDDMITPEYKNILRSILSSVECDNSASSETDVRAPSVVAESRKKRKPTPRTVFSPSKKGIPRVSSVNQRTENGKQQRDVIVLDEESEKIPNEQQNSPFVKKSPIWTTFEAMEMFRKIPQSPHFQPLEQIEEISREGIAIGYMVTFSNVAEKAFGLKLRDPESVMDDVLKTLVDLEKHGFDVEVVRDRVNQLLLLKDRVKKLGVEIMEINDELKKVSAM